MTVGARMFLPKSYCWKPAADQSQSPCYIPLVTASDSSGHVITELDQRKGRRRLGPMDRGEEKHSHISNLPHPSFHVQLIHGDIESIPRNPRDIIYLVSPGSTWSTFRRCQGDLRQLMWRSSDSTMNPSHDQVPHPVCEETHFLRCSVDQAEVGGWGPPVLGFQTSL